MFGASFSAKYARELAIDPKKCLKSALEDLGVRRLRLMSYWNEHEKIQGKYDFKELDWQFELARKFNADVTLCLGLRQPRWPESHWPDWAKDLPEEEWRRALMEFIKTVVERYRGHPCLVSYQLENEAMLRKFGENGNFDRARLRAEFRMVKDLDPYIPVIMTTSDSWGIPVFGPRPDLYGFSIYRYFYDRGAYRHSSRSPFFYRFRATLIRFFKQRDTFIHELQAEPWGPKATAEMTLEEQFISMPHKHVQEAIEFAEKIGLKPIDIWGLEWWYYLKTKHDHNQIWGYMKSMFNR